MDHRRVVKKIFEGKPEGRRRRKNRPTMRWLEDVGKGPTSDEGYIWREKAVGSVCNLRRPRLSGGRTAKK